MTPEKITTELRKMLKTPNGTFHYVADKEVVEAALHLIERLLKKDKVINGHVPVPPPQRSIDLF